MIILIILIWGDVMENSSNMNKTRAASRNNTLFMALGWICALLSLFIYPFIFGVVGVICGILATKNGSRAGLSLIIASIVLMGIGLIFSGPLTNYLTQYFGQIFGR